ncbi:PREDICTED: protein spinster isoform X1 [Wasmannia auropunctata]|uniref:protein spinster isoform X1 n=1 Tax=Wasmannia auropunctata TaxID=64793 RepID=UPI0005EF1B03|nr:PREDICTED: protein spinster isoform X1 [Wasmannia auropunctata]XP_011704388.1 PREDICTED: protein spinster isoform X1 [Wasmannia auropunctata]
MVDDRAPVNAENRYRAVNADQDDDDDDDRGETRVKAATMPSELRSISAADWATVAVLCFVNLINYMDRFTVAGVLTDIRHDFDIGNGKSGLLQTAFILSYMIFAPLFGYLGDRYNRKLIMSGGVFLWCLMTFIGSYMKTYEWFLFFRTLVGIGEASYSTIAPTIISDLFIKDVRSKMLALFYFAIPVGSGLGYITGGETARVTSHWQWGLRITPILGIVAIILLLTVVRDPIRGEREGGAHLTSTTWSHDVKELLKNKSFMLSTGGFTCVAFVTGALAWWAPTYLQLGFQLLPHGAKVNPDDVAYKFGLIGMASGLIGVPLGSTIAQKLRIRWQQADPLICAVGLLISVPLLFFAMITASTNPSLCYTLIFFGQLSLNLNWAIVADILLYVVMPTRRSTAEAFQILIAHALGDAGSPYLIGLISEGLKSTFLPDLGVGGRANIYDIEKITVDFRSLQYAMFLTMFVEVIGALFFFLTALHIQKDKALVDLAIAGGSLSDSVCICNDADNSELQNDANTILEFHRQGESSD